MSLSMHIAQAFKRDNKTKKKEPRQQQQRDDNKKKSIEIVHSSRGKEKSSVP